MKKIITIAFALCALACPAQYRWVEYMLGNTNSTAIISGNASSNYYSGVEIYASQKATVYVRFKLLPGAIETNSFTAYFTGANETGKYDSNRIWSMSIPARGTNEATGMTNFDFPWRYLYFLTGTNANTNTMTNFTVKVGYKFGS